MKETPCINTRTWQPNRINPVICISVSAVLIGVSPFLLDCQPRAFNRWGEEGVKRYKVKFEGLRHIQVKRVMHVRETLNRFKDAWKSLGSGNTSNRKVCNLEKMTLSIVHVVMCGLFG